MRVIIGGIGGGGDIGLALILAVDALRGSEVIIASFRGCPSKRIPGERVAGALLRPLPGTDYGPRFFEDKLVRLGMRRERIYIICTKDPLGEVVEGLKHLISTHQPDAMLYTDIGGDAMLLGYETRLGSYVTDTLARAVLADAARRHGVRAVLGIGALGAEGGGGYLNMEELVADALYLDRAGALLGTYLPKQESAWPAWALLEHAESGMLSLYLLSLAGRVGETRMNTAYLRGVPVQLMPHYKYVLLLDAVKHCAASPLCSAARRGRNVIREWSALRPPPAYQQAVKEVRAIGWERVLEELVRSRLLEGPDLLRLLTEK